MVKSVLGTTGLFRGATRAQLAALAARCTTREAKRGEVVYPRGALLAGIPALAQGMLKLCLQHGADDRVLGLVEPGQTFAEASALLGLPLRYEACALAPVRIVEGPVDAVYRLMSEDPKAVRRTVLELCARCEALLEELESRTLTGTGRLAAYLGALARPGRGTAGLVRLPATKTVVASLLNMKKETLSRLLRLLADQGLIRVGQREITILDARRLAALARPDAA